MLRRYQLGVFLLFLMAGCLPMYYPKDRAPEPKEPPPNPNRIVISNSFGSGIYGGPAIGAKWVLEKSGPCRGSVTTSQNAGPTQPTTTTYELPPETFEECRALLESTRFFSLNVPRPQFLFEASCWNVTAEFNGRKHSVDVYTSDPPAGFARLSKFLDDLPKRGRAISSPP